MSDSLEWETTGSAVDYTCPGFDVRCDDVAYPDGSPGQYHYVDEFPTAVVLPLTPDGDVVVIEEWRQAVGRVNRGLPAGTLEPDEAVEPAARRELTEETGYVAGSLSRLVTAEPANGVTNAVHHHLLAEDCTPTGSQDLDDNESIRVTTTPLSSLLEDALAGRIRDGRALTCLLYYAQTRGLEVESTAVDADHGGE